MYLYLIYEVSRSGWRVVNGNFLIFKFFFLGVLTVHVLLLSCSTILWLVERKAIKINRFLMFCSFPLSSRQPTKAFQKGKPKSYCVCIYIYMYVVSVQRLKTLSLFHNPSKGIFYMTITNFSKSSKTK